MIFVEMVNTEHGHLIYTQSKYFVNKDMPWSVPAVFPVTKSKIPHALGSTPPCVSSREQRLSVSAVSSRPDLGLNGYNLPISAFMHTICPGPGQGVTSIRPAAPLQPAQIGEIINTMARVRFLFVGVNSIRSRRLETGIAGRSQVCLFYQLFIAAEQASN